MSSLTSLTFANQNQSADAAPPASAETRAALAAFRRELTAFLRGKDGLCDVILSAVLSSGHLLFEDVPGVGKTTLVKALSRWLGLSMSRIQCTSDLLPADILGVEVYSQATDAFVFHQGPIFSQIVLVDELNRASPRTQSALLEAMAEGVVSLNRKAYPLPQPFLVCATQNPSDYVGTYRLPESQLDRFAAKVHLDYPSDEREREILSQGAGDVLSRLGGALLDAQRLNELSKAAESVHVASRVVDFAKNVIDSTRRHEALRLGISTRGAVIWMRMARARALVQERAYVTPDDLIFLAVPCLAHRLVPRHGDDARPALEEILSRTEVV
jgi:MoxR-like ATPase